MTARRNPDDLIRAFLDEGRTELPDRAYDAVRAQIDHTRQRVVIGPWREPHMSNITRIGIAAAAVAVAAVLGITLFPRPGGIGAPVPTRTPLASLPAASAPSRTQPPVPSPTLTELTHGELEAGNYVARPFSAPNESIAFTFTVPDGWQAGGPANRRPVGLAPTSGFEAPGGMGLGFLTIASLQSDPCRWNGGPDVPVGPGILDLIDALRQNTGYRVSSPGSVTVGGFYGVLLDIEVPAEVDLASCDEGEFWVWADADGQTIYAQGPETRFHLYVLDVRDQRVIVMTHDFPGTPAADRAELQAIVDSIEITP